MPRTRVCTPEVRRGRLRKADQFLDAAHLIGDLADEDGEIADVYATLCVHAGIAASDVVCCARLGEHSQGENHNEAIALAVPRRGRRPGDAAGPVGGGGSRPGAGWPRPATWSGGQDAAASGR